MAACHPGLYVPLRFDVTNPAHLNAVIKKAPDVNILINNAGVLFRGKLLDENRMEEAWCEMNVNYFAPLAIIRAFAPLIEKNGGGVIANISSIAGLVPMPDMPTYSASKAALHFLTLEARMELAERGIDLIGVYPGPVDTDMLHSDTKEK